MAACHAETKELGSDDGQISIRRHVRKEETYPALASLRPYVSAVDLASFCRFRPYSSSSKARFLKKVDVSCKKQGF